MKLRKQYDPVLIALHMQSTFPNSRIDYEQMARDYLRVSSCNLITNILKFYSDSKIFINETELRKSLPQRYVDENGKKQYWLYWLRTHYPVYYIKRKGSHFAKQKLLTEVLPAVELTTENYMRSGADLYEECVTPYKGATQEHRIPIDTKNLFNYIADATKRLSSLDLNDPRKHNYIQTLFRNMVVAHNIISLAEYTQTKHNIAEPTLFQYPLESYYGRFYYQGSLGFTHLTKEVRTAALGKCHHYDIGSSVYGFYTLLNERLHGRDNLKTSYIYEYITNKTAHRKRLAGLLTHTDQPLSVRMNWIKQALTAIGFGAGTGTGWWDANTYKFCASGLKDIIRNSQDHHAFITDAWVKGFMKEVKMLTDQIVDTNVEHFPEVIEKIKKQQSTGYRKTFLAYLYQQFERTVINNVLLNATTPDNILFVIHDGFYTRKPISLTTAQDTLMLQNPYMRLSHETVAPYPSEAAAQLEKTHREWIAVEEQRARLYQARCVLTSDVMAPFVNERKTAYNMMDQLYNSAVTPNQKTETLNVLKQDPELKEYVDNWFIDYCRRKISRPDLEMEDA